MVYKWYKYYTNERMFPLMKRQKGEGTIRERSPGKWESRIIINGKAKSFYGVSEIEASDKLKNWIDSNAIKSDVTLEEALSIIDDLNDKAKSVLTTVNRNLILENGKLKNQIITSTSAIFIRAGLYSRIWYLTAWRRLFRLPSVRISATVGCSKG